MTEEEAKTKWCPMRRPEAAAFDRVFGPMPTNDGSKCIGSECMMWRSINVRGGAVEQETENGNVAASGYCGLAGKP